MSEVILYGSATHHNTGDLAMMHGLITWLHAVGHAGKVVLLTRNPIESEREFQIPCFASHDTELLKAADRQPSRLRLAWNGAIFLWIVILRKHVSRWLANQCSSSVTRDVVDRLAGARALVIHGSGSFNSVFWRGWLYPKAITAVACRLLKVPVLMTSQGIGPLNGWADRLMARIFFRYASFIGIRDGEFSRECARQHGAASERIFHTGDDSSLLPAAEEPAITNILRAEGVPAGKRLVGVNFRDASSYHPDYRDNGYEKLARALDRLVDYHAVHIVFISVTYDPQDDDRASAVRVKNLMKHTTNVTVIRGVYKAPLIRGLVSRMEIAAGSSYHFLLFALSQAVPALALTKNLYYKAKHDGLMKLYQVEKHRMDCSACTAETLVAHMETILANRQSIKDALRQRYSELAAQEADARQVFLATLNRER